MLTTLWGKPFHTRASWPSPQKHTYYMMKLVCNVFGVVVDHASNMRYTYLCDECAAGPKPLLWPLQSDVHWWVGVTPTLCLDNARICKKHYLVALAVELVVKRFETVRHTPNILFSSFAKTFYNSDVLCIEMLQSIAQQQYANSIIFTSRLMQH